MVEQTAEEQAQNTKNKLKKQGAIGAMILTMIGSTLAVEGGYVNNKADPGGETNMGITKVVARQNQYTGPMKVLPKDVAVSIYYNQYIIAPGYEPLIPYDSAVVEKLFDTSVNMGPPRPSRWFQQSINLQCGTNIPVTGKVDDKTRQVYIACQSKVGATKLCIGTLDHLDAYQKAEYTRLVQVNPKLKIFYKGWIKQRIGNVDRKHCSVAQ